MNYVYIIYLYITYSINSWSKIKSINLKMNWYIKIFLLWVYILRKNHYTNHECNNIHADHYDKAKGGGAVK